MINGIVAAAGLSGENPVGPPIPDALAYLNFITGEFWVGSTQHTLAEVIDGTPTVDESGLYLGDGGVSLKGSALTAFAVEYSTIVVNHTFNRLASGGYRTPLAIENSLTFDGYIYFHSVFSVYAADYSATDSNLVEDDYWITSPTDFYVPETLRAALTRISGKLSFSVVGHAVKSATGTTPTISPDLVTLGGNYGSAGFDGYLKSITLFDPRPDTDLPSLSALP